MSSLNRQLCEFVNYFVIKNLDFKPDRFLYYIKRYAKCSTYK